MAAAAAAREKTAPVGCPCPARGHLPHPWCLLQDDLLPTAMFNKTPHNILFFHMRLFLRVQCRLTIKLGAVRESRDTPRSTEMNDYQGSPGTVAHSLAG